MATPPRLHLFDDLPAGASIDGPALAHALPAMLFACAEDGGDAYLNREWLRYTGLRDAQDLASHWPEVTVFGDPSPFLRAEDASTGASREVTFRLRDAEGVFRRQVARVHTVKGDGAGWAVGIVHEPSAAHEDLQSLATNRDEVLAMVSHELRSPLNAIRGWAQVLRLKGSLAEPQLQALAVIERNIATQARLIDDLLDSRRLWRPDAGLERRPISVAALLDDAGDALRPAAMERHQAFIVHPVDPGVMVHGDPDRLRQVVVNLLSNAVKFTPPLGRIEVVAHERGDRMAIEVRDTGIGLAPQWARQAFEPVRPGEVAGERKGGLGLGLGLGLTLARRLVELHGGRLSATSDGPGLGSTFTVELPVGPSTTAP